MKLSEFKDDEALELLANIIVPLTSIFSDKEVVSAQGNKAKMVSVAIKNHKAEVMEIMARLDCVEPSEYHINALSLPMKVLEIINDKDLLSFFSAQSQNILSEYSGSVMESTEEEESKDSSTTTEND